MTIPINKYGRGDLVRHKKIGKNYVVSGSSQVKYGNGPWLHEYRLCPLTKDGTPDMRTMKKVYSFKMIICGEEDIELIEARKFV